ncbi:MAG TPA: hypothetical protein VGV35_00435 [Bryobacteraceae bacterium]|nr:hypothetical protein [Bryobacteraceae bacterium]
MQNRVITNWRALLCCALVWTVALNGSVIVQLKVLEGEGSVYRTGTRATRGLTVLVTDENGKPLENAAVSFRMPDEGPSGVFGSGLRTEIVTTGPDGRATVWGMQWNKTAGTVEIRITAVKDQARAGIVSTQYLSDSIAPKGGGDGVFTASHKGRGKWILTAVAAGGAAAGLAFARGKGAAPVAAASPAAIQIGNPSITIGHP